MKLTRIIKEGMFGDDVFFIQSILKTMGFFKNKVSGFYGKETIQSISNLQRVNNFRVSGEVDIRTWTILVNENLLNNTIITNTQYDSNIVYRDQNGLMISNNKTHYVSFNEEQIKKETITLGEYRIIHKNDKLLPHFIIERNSDTKKHKAIRMFDDKYWSNYINSNNLLLDSNKKTINIELECVGPIYQSKDNNFYSINGDMIDVNDISIFPNQHQGYTYWGKYTDYQIETLGKLIEYLSNKWDIDISNNLFDESWFGVKLNSDLGSIRNRHNIGLERGLTPQKKLLEVLIGIK